MANPRTVTIVSLSIALGLFFIFMGIIKLTPRLNKDAYNEMVSPEHSSSLSGYGFICDRIQKRAYKSYMKALPILKKLGISSVIMRKTIGSLELSCGIVLTLVSGRPRDVANFILLILVLIVLFFHQLVGDPLKRYAHALVFGILLTCRLLVTRQTEEESHEKKALRGNGAHFQDTKKIKRS